MAETTAGKVPARDPEIRRTGIGASEAAEAVGISKWGSPLQLYMKKRGELEDEAGPAAEWGNILEPVVLRQYAMRTEQHVLGRSLYDDPVVYEPSGMIVHAEDVAAPDSLLGTLRHPDHGWMFCHLDAVVLAPQGLHKWKVVKLVESKTAGFMRRGDFGAEGDMLPPEYICQAQHQAEVVRGVTGQSLDVDVPVLIGGNDWRILGVQPSAAFVAMLVSELAAFWAMVREGRPPPAEGRDRSMLVRMFPQHHLDDDRVIGFGTPEYDAALALIHSKAEAKQQKEHVERAAAAVMELMKTDGVWLTDAGKIMWRANKPQTTTDWKSAFAEVWLEDPSSKRRPLDEFLEPFQKTRTTRPLRVYPTKEG